MFKHLTMLYLEVSLCRCGVVDNDPITVVLMQRGMKIVANIIVDHGLLQHLVNLVIEQDKYYLESLKWIYVLM
jgi:hypothetical protein